MITLLKFATFSPPTYNIVDDHYVEFQGKFYESELFNLNALKPKKWRMKAGKELTIDSISNVSSDIFDENFIAKFRYQLAQLLIFEGKRQAQLTSISSPSNINNVNLRGVVLYKDLSAEIYDSYKLRRHPRKVCKDIYDSLDPLMQKILFIAQLNQTWF